MHSADWIFKNHTAHLLFVQVLSNMLVEADEERMRCQEDPDSEIEGLCLSRPALNGMPRQPAHESRTEHVVLKLDALYSETEYTAKRRELRRY